MNIRIENGLANMLKPFNKFWKPHYCEIFIETVGFEQSNITIYFYDFYHNKLTIPESIEIKKIVDLWDEKSFENLIQDVFVNHIFQNMITFGLNVYKITL